jgi:nitroimidazol reductase NimA-like FMN-containing flavoprotein (pyridoxamine 5'-phosphate oxidase superfamily)
MEGSMAPELRDFIVRLLDEHRIMTLATNRPDGWPQATVVGYANEGFNIYCFVARMSQKYSNIVRDPRISAAIASDFSNPLEIRGLSLGGKATPVTDESEFERTCATFMKRYPEYASWPRPSPAISPMLRITPTVFSVLDYSKGFGHSDLVKLDDVREDGHSARRLLAWWSSRV